MADKKFSELETASEIKNSDFMALSQDTGGGYVSLKATILAIATKIVTAINFTSALNTENKTITGAINEVAQGGGGGGGGHVIVDDNDDDLTQRANLKFAGTYSEDDSENEVSVVNISRQMTRAEFDLLTDDEKKGLIQITDEYISESGGYSETTLWSGTELCNDVNFHELTLSDDITNYDMFYILVKDPDNQTVMPLFMTNAVELGKQYISAPWTNLGAFFQFDVTDKIKVARLSGTLNITYLKVVGIKVGIVSSENAGIHYSTDEQVIGTYFGDTLYQKTIVLSSGVSIADSWTTIYTDALIGTIAQLVDVKYNNVDNKGVYGVLNFKPNGNNLQAVYPITGGLNVLAGAKFTLQYTKQSS